jgi:two-component system, LytTR family, response regulator
VKLKALIADDEPLARERLRFLLASQDDVEIAAECRNGKEVVETLKTGRIDFLLLDIQMPGMSGVDIVRSIGAANMPATVFVTAYSDYAVKAFELHALDYLVKPVEAGRLGEAIQRVRERVRSRESFIKEEQLSSVLKVLQTAATALNAYPQRLLAKNGAKDCVVSVADIEWIQAADYYACLHAKGKEHLLRESIKVLEKKLDPAKFVRLHRSAIVNVEYVREIHRDGRTEGWVLLSSGTRVRMNKAGWQRLVSISGMTA